MVGTWNGEASSDIDGGHDLGNASFEEHFTVRDLHVDQAAVLLFVPSESLCCVTLSLVQYIPQ